MDDLISRAVVVDAIEGVDWYHQNQHGEMVHGANPDEHQAWYKTEDIYKAVESVPSAQQWIPCKTALPDKSGLYIVTEKTAYGVNVHSRYWNLRQGGSFWSGWCGDKVLAWMPLPEPWKGEQDG